MTHIPLCYNCNTREVHAPYTSRDGTGFCSGVCEAEAQAVEDAYSYELDMDLRYETYKDGRYS